MNIKYHKFNFKVISFNKIYYYPFEKKRPYRPRRPLYRYIVRLY